jgi:hypothetical protein
MGRFRKLSSGIAVFCLVSLALELTACGGGGGSSGPPAPVTVNISPSTASLTLGSTLQFNASALQNKQVIASTFTFHSSNTKALSIAPSGLACAGTWDSRFIVCNPGETGVVQVTASGSGATSTAANVYVHPQVTGITITPVNPPSIACLSQNLTEVFQASVSSSGTDITSLVGPLNWGLVDGTVGKISTTATGLQPNQVQVTANQPGLTHVFAAVGNFNGTGPTFETCAVNSISLAVSSSGAKSLQVSPGASTALTATVIDSQGNPNTAANLTWYSSQTGAATAKPGSVTAVGAGGAAIAASCAPPNCNVSLQPIFSGNVVGVTVTGSTNTSTIYVTSTGCGNASGCQSMLVPITSNNDTAGTAVTVPHTPNSVAFNATTGFFGTASGLEQLSLTNNTFSLSNTIRGKVLALSPDGKLLVVSNTSVSPNVVNIFHTDTGSVTSLLLSGVTAAAFSPDSVKAYLVGGSNLYVYSTREPLRIISLSTAANGAAFLTTGSFGFLAGGTASAVNVFANCDNSQPPGPNDTAPITGTPTHIVSVPDSAAVLAVNTPGITTIPVTTDAVGCPPSISVGTPVFHDFAQGPFAAKQLLVSSDGTRAYVISNLPSVLVYEIGSGLVSTIPLASTPTPLSAVLTVKGNALYVGANDGKVHHLDTAAQSDVKQIPVTLCSGASVTCQPDLLALKP